MIYYDPKRTTPWWTSGSIREVERFLDEDCFGRANVFEWGSGVSSRWLAERSSRVITVEHDDTWVKKTLELTDDQKHKVTLLDRKLGKGYSSAIENKGLFDLITCLHCRIRRISMGLSQLASFACMVLTVLCLLMLAFRSSLFPCSTVLCAF
jgi:hypothetical protein